MWGVYHSPSRGTWEVTLFWDSPACGCLSLYSILFPIRPFILVSLRPGSQLHLHSASGSWKPPRTGLSSSSRQRRPSGGQDFEQGYSGQQPLSLLQEPWPCLLVPVACSNGVGEAVPSGWVRPTNPLTGWDPGTVPLTACVGSSSWKWGPASQEGSAGWEITWAGGADRQFPAQLSWLSSTSLFFLLILFYHSLNGTFSWHD